MTAMPGSEPIKGLNKRMTFKDTLFKVTGRRKKNPEDNQRASTQSTTSTATNASEASAASAATIANLVIPASDTPIFAALPPTREKYCTLRLSDDLAISIGDAFDPNPKATLDDAPRFEYGLIRWPKFIRLLLVFPAIIPEEPLETLLFHADLHEVPFQMLKYEAGDLLRTMHLNGMQTTVHQGLYDALLAMRDRSKRRNFTVLWVDEVCVNQADPVERDAHARLKRDIVAACTGKTAVDSALNANFKRGRADRRSLEVDGAESSRQSTGQPARQTRRHLSNASELSGTTAADPLSRAHSRAQSVGASSVKTTERIRAISDSSDTESPDDKGKAPAKSRKSSREQSAGGSMQSREGRRARRSISFDVPRHPRAEDGYGSNGDDSDAAATSDASPDINYAVMKSQPF
ncbi:hypothetical protein VDGE_10521 [Verticillium dahliae]|uniref:Heterokaryon incompatibility domain-containing protein n=1 Tax=Verticillium dahliae TaxID=27337 RepID=A0A444RJF4_VERDA|nr:hypothetical protein VDGE_10521 [Verticillium dahliae]